MRVLRGDIIVCSVCGNERYYEARHLKNAKYCSPECYFKDKKGKATWNKGITGYKQPNISKALTGRFRGKNSYRWKEEGAGYGTIHEGLTRQYGKPQKCEHCSSTKSVQWANKSGTYNRDISDWLKLCIKCHRKYDNHSAKLKAAWQRGAYASR